MAEAVIDPLVSKLLTFLESHEPLFNHVYTEEEVAANIYVKSEVRLNILKNLMSQFSEIYRNDLTEAQDLEWELIRQIHALQFSEDTNKITFVMAECPIKEQRQIFENIITALEYVQIADMGDSYNFVENDQQLNEMRVHLDEATKLIEKYKHYLETDRKQLLLSTACPGDNLAAPRPQGLRPVSHISQCHSAHDRIYFEPMKKEILGAERECGRLLTDTEIEETCDAIKTISHALSSLPLDDIPGYQLEPTSDINKLCDHLIAYKETILNSGRDDLEVDIIDPSKYLEDIRKFRNNSKILNLKTESK